MYRPAGLPLQCLENSTDLLKPVGADGRGLDGRPLDGGGPADDQPLQTPLESGPAGFWTSATASPKKQSAALARRPALMRSDSGVTLTVGRGQCLHCQSFVSPFGLSPAAESSWPQGASPRETAGSRRPCVCWQLLQVPASVKLAVEWADFGQVVEVMEKKELKYERTDPMSRQTELGHEMRAILLDWMNEVCEAYRLQRETYYLAADYVDRFLAVRPNVSKSHFQGLGTAALFIAAKLEEIYPPKLDKFAFVTDGACTGKDILNWELQIVMALRWYLTPMTVVFYLNLYLEIIENMKRRGSAGAVGCEERLAPADRAYTQSTGFCNCIQYPADSLAQAAQIMDLCLLSDQWCRFPYRLLAAAALYHLSSGQHALLASGLDWPTLEPCVHWMTPFVCSVRKHGLLTASQLPPPSTGPALNALTTGQPVASCVAAENCLVQTHRSSLRLLDEANELRLKIDQSSRDSPDNLPDSWTAAVLTPPLSGCPAGCSPGCPPGCPSGCPSGRPADSC